MSNALTIFQVIQLVGFAFLLATGQLLFKRVALDLTGEGISSLIIQVISNPVAWCAIALYGAATGLWILILRVVPLSIAYPFSALGFVIVPIAASTLFGEPLTIRYVIGAVTVIAGLYILAQS